ncbi:Cell wall hydrolase CwlJ, involved in spore germination [Loktanella atrilutea]|uniref:Cell wall hydrolase CwlJ, involved in spore germination n=1 Tax=Loktanella atrilutea TaxID=366533 RepID=A0A1M5AQM7_LOKAT|nr:cell wall hydrolase [Loktanella atrilutea]SHF32540.1 Cell wall hydrolase CwlJ, involved in spore germination [Loktanella atrilutea]
MNTALRRLLTACMTLATLTLAQSATAEEVLAARLGAVLGQERQALAIVPDNRLSALTAVPDSARRNAAPSGGDAVMTDAYLSSMSAPKGNSEWECLADALYFEARGEGVQGIFAVGEVIMNRVDSAAYPNTVCGVVHQGSGKKFACQFSWTCDNNSDAIGNKTAFARVGKVAKLLIDGVPRRLTQGATHYHTKAVHPSWANRFPKTATIGAHYFYRQPTRSASN